MSLGVFAAMPCPAFAQSPIKPRLNPTGRDIVLTVPAHDGTDYLGDMPLTIGKDDVLHIPADRTLQLLADILSPSAIKALRAALAGKAAVTLDELTTAGIKADYDPRLLELHFVIPVAARVTRQVLAAPDGPAQNVKRQAPASVSGYLNVRVATDLAESGPNSGLGDPLVLVDAVTRLHNLVVETDAVWAPGTTTPFQRLDSRIVYDDLGHMVRISVGDLETQARGFQVTPQMAGLSIVRSYSALNPQQIISPSGDQRFSLERPSTVDILANGQQVRRLSLGPGNYDLRDFPFVHGANDIQVNIVDDTGRSSSLHFNIFVDQTQLETGLSEFGLYAGVEAPLTASGPHYGGREIFTGFYRRGMSASLTLGANVQIEPGNQMLGGEALLGTALGSFGASVAMSHSAQYGSGEAVQISFQRQNGSSDSFSLSIQQHGRTFSPTEGTPPNNPYAYETDLAFGHAFGRKFYAGFSGRYAIGQGGNPNAQNYSVTAGYVLSDRARLSGALRYQQDTTYHGVSALLSLTLRMSDRTSASTEYDTMEHRARASFQTQHGSDVGGYYVDGEMDRDTTGADLSVDAGYIGNRAELTLSHMGNFSPDLQQSISQRTSFKVASSLAFADGALSIGRPISDSFAIVVPHDSMGKARILVDPEATGFTADSGVLSAATMPNLSAYVPRTVVVDVRNAPLGMDIGQGSFALMPAYHGGYRLVVGSAYHLTAFGRMLNAEGHPIPLLSGLMTEVAHPDHAPIVMFTNRIGKFSASGVAPGRWKIVMSDDKKTTFQIEIKKDAGNIVNLGDISPAGN